MVTRSDRDGVSRRLAQHVSHRPDLPGPLRSARDSVDVASFQ